MASGGLSLPPRRPTLKGAGKFPSPAAPPPPQLFQLFKALADQPGTDDIPTRLATAGVDRIRVTLASQETSPPPPAASVASPGDVESREPIIPRASRPTGTEGILRGEPLRDIKAVPIDGVPLVSHDPPPPPEADALPGTAGPPRATPPMPPSPAPPPPVAPSAAPTPPAGTSTGRATKARAATPEPPPPSPN